MSIKKEAEFSITATTTQEMSDEEFYEQVLLAENKMNTLCSARSTLKFIIYSDDIVHKLNLEIARLKESSKRKDEIIDSYAEDNRRRHEDDEPRSDCFG